MNVPAGVTSFTASFRFSTSACTASWPTYDTGPSQVVNLISETDAIVKVMCSAKSGKSSMPITDEDTSSIEPSPPKPVRRSLTYVA